MNCAYLKKKTIDDFNHQKIRQEEQYWRQILDRFIGLVTVPGIQNLAFCCTTEKLYSASNGNFVTFVEYVAFFDPIMNEHLHS